MKLHVEIEVSNADLDAVAFALSLEPKFNSARGIKIQQLQAQVNAQCAIVERLKVTASDMIRNSHDFLAQWKRLKEKNDGA